MATNQQPQAVLAGFLRSIKKMSKYEWERGTLKLSTAAWKPFRDGLAREYNKIQGRRYELALKVHKFLTAQKSKAKRGSFNGENELSQVHSASSALYKELTALEIDGSYALRKILFTEGFKALRLPKKKDFPLAVATKETRYRADEGGISLSMATREVTWTVPENNHAVDSAWDSCMGRVFFKLLAGITWTRGTGGEFCGNDEYNQDSQDEGGGANYVTRRFGPHVEPKRPSVRPTLFRSARNLHPARSTFR